MPSSQNGHVYVWFANGSHMTKTISRSPSKVHAVFVSSNGDIYASSESSSSFFIDKFILNNNNSTLFAATTSICSGLFIDINDVLYCSMKSGHRVIKKTLDISSDVWTTVAGGLNIAGSNSTMLNGPRGIFVDVNLDLYVADCGNNRIQLFHLGVSSGITVAGSTSPNTTIPLSCPSAVILDADKYLFIVDTNNHRIVGSGPNGFRCLVGCSGSSGSPSEKLNIPSNIAFDSLGNIYVADRSNDRIQKFLISTNSCSEYKTTLARVITKNERKYVPFLVLSYNEPQFCPDAMWHPNASTFVSNDTVGLLPYGIFINGINTLYTVSRSKNQIFTWFQGANSSTPTRTISSDLNNSLSIFVTLLGDIYVDNGFSKNVVIKWTSDFMNSNTVMKVNGSCYGLFVDINDTIYCSLADHHQVLKLLTNNSINETKIAAGNGSSGSSLDLLNSPRGIFVTTNFELYIADCNNNRIQLFSVGQLNGTTVSENTTLNCPTGVLLDKDKYLFIVDSENHRILRSHVNGFHCIVGCLQKNGSSVDQLNNPQSMSFDSYGNIYVTDRNNNRIQKFKLIANFCSKFMNQNC